MVSEPTTKSRSNGKHAALDIQVRLNMDELTFGDIRFMNRIEQVGTDNIAPEDFERMAAFLDKIIVGGIDRFPVSATPEIMKAISEEIKTKREGREKNSQRRRRRSRG